MAETLSALIEKLIDARLKGFFVQEKVHRARDAGEGIDAEVVSFEEAVELEAMERTGATGSTPRGPVITVSQKDNGRVSRHGS